MPIPARSIPMSMTAPPRPSTKVWWYSSETAYSAEITAAAGSALRVVGRSVQNHRVPNAPKMAACPIFRRITSQVPRPVSRSDWAESQKIAAISATGAGARLAVRASGLTVPLVVLYNGSRNDLSHLEVPLRGRGHGRACPFGRGSPRPDRDGGGAEGDAGAVPGAAVLDPAALRPARELPGHEGRLHAGPARRPDHRARGRAGARRQGRRGGQGGGRDLGRGRRRPARRVLPDDDRRHRPPRGRGRRLADVPHLEPKVATPHRQAVYWPRAPLVRQFVRQSGRAAAQRDVERVMEPDLNHEVINLDARDPSRIEI